MYVVSESIESTIFLIPIAIFYESTVEPPNNEYFGDEHCSEVVPSSEVEMYGQYIGRG